MRDILWHVDIEGETAVARLASSIDIFWCLPLGRLGLGKLASISLSMALGLMYILTLSLNLPQLNHSSYCPRHRKIGASGDTIT